MSRRPPPTVELLGPDEAEVRQRRAAGALAAAGLGPGDRVAFCLPSSAALLCAALGAVRTGVIPVMLNATLTPGERAALVDDAAPSLVVEHPGDLAALGQGAEVALAPWPLARPMYYTSGTTGRPKGVYSGLFDEATAQAVLDDEADLWGFHPGDLHLVCSPLYHSVAIRFAGATLLRGGSCIVLGHFEAASALAVLRQERPTTTFMVPSHLQRLMALPELGAEERFGSLRLLVHAGEPCPPALKRAVLGRCADGALWEFYGSTEGQFTVCSPTEWLERPGTVGRARPGRRLEIDPHGLEEAGVEPPASSQGPESHAPGVIWCHAPAFARFSYWGDPQATAAAWRDDAFSVGDVGRVDHEGYLYFAGRRDDLIISGGVNVYPAEVEAALAEVPGVQEVAVFGRDDPRWGQRVCAAVVGQAGLDLTELERAARDRLAPHKRPKDYQRVERLPRTATGKIRRRALAQGAVS